MQLDRNRLFALLGALEEDLRFIIEAHLLTTRHDKQILGPAYQQAIRRFESDEHRDVTQTSVVDYLDLGDEIEILQRWRQDLPAQTRYSIEGQSERLATLVPIRNRVVHRRPLLVDDFVTAERVLTQLDRDGFDGVELKEALRSLREEPSWEPVEPIPSIGGRTLNNLPLADYDETGLVGRRRELDQLAKQLKNLSSSRRGPVLTVIGPGGIGKTALALQALHDLVNDETCPYDLVSWVSLKTERLTSRGVQSIQDAVLSVEQAMPALVEALEPSFDGTASQLADSLDGLTALIVIDNLETVSGREVLDLIDTLPESVSYLFTSRQGLGEIERRFPLGPLNEHMALDLLRRLARARELGAFANMDQDAGIDLVRQLGSSPLGLKWFVASVEIGKDPQEIVRHPEDLARFCVENVFGSLDDDARTVANVLHVLARPATAQEIRLYLPDMSPDRLRASIQALNRRMLIRNDLVAGSISETFETTEPLSDYLRFADVVSPDEERQLREADDEYRREEERHRLEAATDPLRPNIIQGGLEHRASVLLLRDALSRSKRGDVDDALKHIREAERLDPEFWEISRVRGFILSSAGQVDSATSSYLRAVEFTRTDKEAAAAKYFFAGHLSRSARDPERAATIAREAHEVLGLPRTAFELGRALTYNGDFESAETALREAMQSNDVRTRLIATTQLLDCMKRRADAEATVDRQPDTAVATFAAAIDVAQVVADEGLVDRRLTDKSVSLISDVLKTAGSCRDAQLTQDTLNKALALVHQLGRDAHRSRSFDYLKGHARRFLSQRPDLVDAIPLISVYAVNDQDIGPVLELGREEAENALLGSVKVWKPDRHFGFISTLDRQEDLFFHLASLSSPADEIRLQRAVTVRFNRSVGPDGRVQAQDVRVEESEDDVFAHRRLVVARLHKSGSCLFAVDPTSGATVFVNRNAMRNDSEWGQIEIDLELESTVEIEDDGRFRAATRSTRICT